MPNFIESVVKDLIKNHSHFEDVSIVLPGKRPVLFFRKAFQKEMKNNILPQFFNIEEWMENLSGIQKISGITLWFKAYESYLKIVELPESFENFIQWIPTLLKDFDDIDAALAKSSVIFDYLISSERIKKWGEDEIKVNKNELIQNHFNFWKMAHLLYVQLQKDLLKNDQGYSGMIFRKAVKMLPKTNFIANQKIIFVGFNALTQAEQKIIFELEKLNIAIIYWDSDEYYMHNKVQESGTFLRAFKQKSNQFNWVFNEFIQFKNITSIGVGKQIGQAKYVHQLLSNIPKEELSETVLVLADENLLPAVLTAIPNSIEHINITMGIPLNKVPMAYFFKSIFSLQVNREKLGKGKTFYYKNIIEIIESELFKEGIEEVKELAKNIRKNNWIFTTPKFLEEKLGKSSLKNLFIIPNHPKNFVEEIIEWIDEKLNTSFDSLDSMNKEFLFRFKQIFNQLYDEISTHTYVEDYKTLQVLYTKILQNENLAFIGEPLQGLQIVGLLETRLLDFKNIIMTSVNEGILPLGRTDNTFIPFDIRHEMQLNTYAENDAIYAYHFYRLIQRATNINLLYNTETDGMGTGEASRFIKQLTLESPHNIEHKVALPTFAPVQPKILEINKTKTVIKELENWLERGISASSLINYLRNPIDFYNRHVLHIKEWENAEETVNARELGNIIHATLEELYTPLLGKILIKNDLIEAKKRSQKLLEKYFEKEYGNKEFKQGKNQIIFKIAQQFIYNTLTNDEELCEKNELIIKALECNLICDFTLKNQQKIKLKGVIDRIDSLNGTTRVIDYKTGKVDESSLKLKQEKIPIIFEDVKYDKPIQLIFYAFLYFNNYNESSIQLAINPLKNKNIDVLQLIIEGKENHTKKLLEDSNSALQKLIEEILDPTIPLTEKELPSYFN